MTEGCSHQMINEITSDELKQKLEEGITINLIDVREPDEWDAGHIKQARNIPLSQFQAREDEVHLVEGDVIFICRSGARSGKVCEYLRLQGFDVTNVNGGMLEWHGDVEFGE